VDRAERMGRMEDFAEFMRQHPHNTDTSDNFMLLVNICYSMDKSGKSLEEFVKDCLYHYGGTVAAAMIDYLHNHL
jgi:hypothetical protein